MSAPDLDGKVAVVTGAGRGIGRAAALALAHAGAHVVLLARTAEQLARVAREIEASGRRALALPTDVSDEAAVEEATQATLEEFGRVDVLVNNAGIAPVLPLLESKLEDVRRILEVNVVSVYLCARAFGAHMVAARSGDIDQTIRNTNEATRNLAVATRELGPTLKQANVTLHRMDKLTLDADAVVTGDGIAQLSALVADGRRLVTSLTKLSDELNREPTRVIFGDRRKGYEPK